MENKEHLSDKGAAQVTKETREAVRPVVKQLTEKLGKMGFDKGAVREAVRKGLDAAKEDVN